MRAVRVEVIGPEKRTALLEMRTAVLETSAAESMRVNGKKQYFVAAKVCSLHNES